jgi:hypothetical protein
MLGSRKSSILLAAFRAHIPKPDFFIQSADSSASRYRALLAAAVPATSQRRCNIEYPCSVNASSIPHDLVVLTNAAQQRLTGTRQTPAYTHFFSAGQSVGLAVDKKNIPIKIRYDI